jgi:hypothetical protein
MSVLFSVVKDRREKKQGLARVGEILLSASHRVAEQQR